MHYTIYPMVVYDNKYSYKLIDIQQSYNIETSKIPSHDFTLYIPSVYC